MKGREASRQGRSPLVGLHAEEVTKARPRRLIGFEMSGRGIARHGYPLSNAQGEALGQCTSGAPSPTLGTNIGLGYVPPAYSAVGAELVVDCRGRAIPARVVKTPFYRRPAAGQRAS